MKPYLIVIHFILHCRTAFKLIDYNFNPDISTYQEIAYPISILFASDYDLYPWLMSRFTQLVWKEGDNNKFHYNMLGWFENEGIFQKYILSVPIRTKDFFNIIYPIITSFIQRGFYSAGSLDEYYIPRRKFYQTNHYLHDCLIYGYDEVDCVFHIAGYTDSGFYESSILPYDNFKDAMKSTNADVSNLVFYKPDFSNTYVFEKERFVKDIHEYLHSYGSAWRPCGLNACKKLMDHIAQDGGEYIDLRYTHLLHEHKRLMTRKIDFLIKNGLLINTELSAAFSQIENNALLVKNLSQKFNLTHKQSSKNEIISMINNIIKEEEKIYSKLLTGIA